MRHPRRKIPIALRRKIREQARFRCGFCLCSEVLIGMSMEFEHIHTLASGGDTTEKNLWLSCRRCNEAKGRQLKAVDPEASDIVALFNPREQRWEDHFRWNNDGTEIIGIISVGRATIFALKLNNPVIVVTRRLWVSAGWWPPTE